MKKGIVFALALCSSFALAQDLKNDFKGTSKKEQDQRNYAFSKVFELSKSIYFIENAVSTNLNVLDGKMDVIESVTVLTNAANSPQEFKTLFDNPISGIILVKVKKDSPTLETVSIQDLNKKYNLDPSQPIYVDGNKVSSKYNLVESPKNEYSLISVEGQNFLAVHSKPKLSPGI